jgi:hypothetical protein
MTGYKAKSLMRGHSVGEKLGPTEEEHDYVLKICDFGQSRKLQP